MKTFLKQKADAISASAFSIFIYFLFVASDIYTTYLATPDLKYEGNLLIRHFNLDWPQIILKDSITVILVSVGLVFALNYLDYYYGQENFFSSRRGIYQILKTKKYTGSFIVLSFFYFHLSFSVFLAVNNYLHYIFIYRLDNFLYKLSSLYIHHIIIKFPYIFFWYRGFFIITGILFALYRVKSIRDRYNTTQNSDHWLS
jgi:hypothetical protein